MYVYIFHVYINIYLDFLLNLITYIDHKISTAYELSSNQELSTKMPSPLDTETFVAMSVDFSISVQELGSDQANNCPRVYHLSASWRTN